jgi:hypothetical protein
MTRMEERSRFRAPWVIFWVAFGLRVGVILVSHQYKVRTDQANFNFGFEAGRIARALVTGHGYANPFNGNSGPTAWLPPLYPLLLAGVFKVFGVYTRASGFVILALNSLFSAAVVPAVYEIGARCFDAKGIARRASVKATPVGLWAAWVWAVYPAALQYAVHWIWEMSLTVAFLRGCWWWRCGCEGRENSPVCGLLRLWGTPGRRRRTGEGRRCGSGWCLGGCGDWWRCRMRRCCCAFRRWWFGLRGRSCGHGDGWRCGGMSRGRRWLALCLLR